MAKKKASKVVKPAAPSPGLVSTMKEFEQEVRTASQSFHLWLALNRRLESKDFLDAVNEEPGAWSMILHSLQLTFLITLGRIFDKNPASMSVHTFLRVVAASWQEFLPDALEVRRVNDAGGVRPDYLDGYLATRVLVTPQTFDAIRNQVESWAPNWEKLGPIRNKVMAHNDIAYLGKKNDLFKQARIDELQGLIVFLRQTQLKVQELYINGSLNEQHTISINDARDAEADAEGIMEKMIHRRSSARKLSCRRRE